MWTVFNENSKIKKLIEKRRGNIVKKKVMLGESYTKNMEITQHSYNAE